MKYIAPMIVTVALTPILCVADEPATNTTRIIARSVAPAESSVSLTRHGITREDFARIEATLPNIQTAIPIRHLVEQRVHGVGSKSTSKPLWMMVTGTVEAFSAVARTPMHAGRFLNQKDESHRRTVAVISLRHAETLFDDLDPIGRALRIGDSIFTVVGIAEQTPDNAILIPISTMRTRFGDVVVLRKSGSFEASHYELSELWLDVTGDQEQVRHTVEILQKLLERSHQDNGNAQKDFEVRVQP